MEKVFQDISKIFQNSKKEFYPYIEAIRFPVYKKISHNEFIDFTYPITAIIGGNGTSKSSVLRAIYACPKGKSISEYWFETRLDNISDLDSSTKKPQSSFIYKYYHTPLKKDIELLKTRVNRKGKPENWEPSRPKKEYGMEEVSKEDQAIIGNQTRFPLIEKNVIYLDFRHEAISAYDKFFYYGSFKKTKSINSKQDFIRSRSKYLSKIIEDNKTNYSFYDKERINKNVKLSDVAVSKISKILGKNYSSIRIVEHCLFGNTFEKTIYLSAEELKYSEAFAGSGEFAIVSLVDAILNAKEKSLIILDEPEVSLHPAAQEQLLLFIAEQVKINKHQVVFATHSPTLIKYLPIEAIKLLVISPDGTVKILQNVLPEQAFIKIGIKPEKKTIIVEDVAARIVIEHILKKSEYAANLIDVKISPNGADSMKTVSILDSALFHDDKNTLYIFDGDQKGVTPLKDPDTIPVSDNDRLAEIIREQMGCEIKPLNSSNDKQQKIDNQRKYLKYCYNYVNYFPTKDPEDIIWKNMNDDEKQGINYEDAKVCFSELAKKEYGEDKGTSEYILKTEELFLNRRVNPL